MDPACTLSDDDYDVISNPGDHSLESSVANLQPLSLTVPEPHPCHAASQKFESSQWTAADIQEYVRKVAGGRCSDFAGYDNRIVRVYVDGLFDPLNVGHALQLRQAKLSFPRVYLIVGVFSDLTSQEHNYGPTAPEVERYELVRHCRWVDEVITEAPWELNEEFLRRRHIDFVAVEEGASVSPAYDRVRVKGYDEVKRLAVSILGKAIPTRRISSLRSSPIGASPSTSFPPTPTPPFAEPPEDFTGHINMGNAL